jgi:hypothetical protein
MALYGQIRVKAHMVGDGVMTYDTHGKNTSLQDKCSV